MQQTSEVPRNPVPVPNVSVWMIHPDLSRAPRYHLPDGYTIRFYREGDITTWVRIQQAAETFFVPLAEHFRKYMPGDLGLLSQRVMFLVDPSGQDIGTVTAWDGDHLTARKMGLVHWVAVRPAAQGQGLSRPMLSAALERLSSLGFTDAWLETGTGRISALNLYLRFGFEPYIRTDEDLAGWQAVAPRLKYPFRI